MMDEKTAYLYSQLYSYKALVRKTKGFISWALKNVKNPYIACSFGKDSSVMLHLCLECNKDIPVNFLCKIETDLIDDYTGVIKWWEEKFNASINRICYKGWLEGSNKTGIANNMPTDGFDSYFVGIREEESVGRRITLKKHGKFFKSSSGLIRISPMSEWTTRDIATYMLVNELPILKAYMREGFESRTTSNIPSKYPHESIARLKDSNIEAYNKLLKILPDAKYFT